MPWHIAGAIHYIYQTKEMQLYGWFSAIAKISVA